MKIFLRRYGLPLLSAVLMTLAFPTPSVFPLAWIALTPLLVHTRRLSPKGAAWAFLISGWATHALLVRWILVQVYWAGGWAIAGQIFLTAMYGAYWAAAGFLWRYASRDTGAAVSALMFALIWAGMEWAQNASINVFGGPASLAYSQGANIWILQWAAIGGVALIGFLMALASGLAAAIFEPGLQRWISPAVAVAIVALAHAGGRAQLDATRYGDDPFIVGMYQSDYPIEMKHDSEYRFDMVDKATKKSIVLAENADLDLMVWPEALIMTTLERADIAASLREFGTTTGSPLFTGAARNQRIPPEAFNSAYLIQPDGTVSEPYDKIKLAPFGEYIPLVNLIPFLPKMVPAIGQMGAGKRVMTFDVDGRTLGPMICFEVLFPSMAAELRESGADFLTVVTNLGWFGASNAIPHEFDIARVRAIETRMPLVHVANTGITGIFDPYGRFSLVRSVVDQYGNFIPLPEDLQPRATIQHRLIGALPLPEAERSPVAWAPHGVGWIALVIFVAMAVAVRLRRRGELVVDKE